MKIKIDGDVLSNAVKQAQKLVQALAVSVSIDKKTVKVVGAGNGNAFSTIVDCEVVEKGGASNFMIDATILLTALSKRKEVTIQVNESSIVLNSSRYQAELLINAFEEVVVVPDEVKSDKGLKIKDKFLNAIRDNLSKIELKPLLATYDYIPMGVRATKEGTFVACFDFYQSAFYFDKELTGNLEFTLPSSLFSVLTKEIKHQDYTLSVTESAVYAFNDMFELSMSLPTLDGEQIKLENMLDLYKSLKSQKTTKISLKTEGINSLLDNAKAVYEKDSTFTFTTKGNKCQLELRSSFGTIKSTVMLEEAPKKDVKFSCDFGFFSTLLAKAPPTLDLRVSETMMLFHNKPVTYLLSLV